MEDGIRGERLREQEGFEATDASGGKAEPDEEKADNCGEKAEQSAEKADNCSRKEEPGQSLLAMIMAAFPGKKQDIRTYSGLTLAYIGDVVYDLIIRTVVVKKGNRPVNELHRITVKYVSAPAQARIVQALENELTEDEKTVFRRGKNSKPHTTAKNASVSDYLKATGFEAVLGYLYLTDNMPRALELVKKGIILAGMEI